MINRTFKTNKVLFKLVIAGCVTLLFFITVPSVDAATLSASPSTGVYTSNGTFAVSILVNTQGKPINASDGVLSFNPNELSVVSVSRTGSIFNLWVTEPAFSNSAGTINFSGGLPSGYTGKSGRIMTVTFRSRGAGTAKVSFNSGSVLANDGRGTNVLTAMNSGNYTIQAAAIAPEPEVIEYIATANTPSAPVVTSNTHPDPDGWTSNNDAELKWVLPNGVTSVRTLLNDNPTSVPTKVYESPIENITLSDLSDGVSYFHLQFKNAEGWGRVTHYRLAVDTQKPTTINIHHPEDADYANPNQLLRVDVEDDLTSVNKYRIVLDSNQPYDYVDVSGSSTVVLESLSPGFHSLIIEAFDQAGNSIVGTYSFTVASFDKPIFTDYPSEINEEVIPVLKGMTRPNSSVQVSLHKIGSGPVVYNVASDTSGQFVFIPEGTFDTGVYEISAIATDEFGAQSEPSEVIRIAVQQPGFLRIGSMIVSVLSVIIPLIVLFALSIGGLWYLIVYSRRFRKKVRIESLEALQILRKEFGDLQTILGSQESMMQASRKTKKLTKAEADMVEVLQKSLQSSQSKVEKEIADIAELSKRKRNYKN